MNYLDHVQMGMEGRHRGLYNGLDRANRVLHGIQKGTYYLVGANSGVGKTTLTDYSFLLSPYFNMIKGEDKRPVEWLYYSFEISKLAKMHQFMSFTIDEYFDVPLDRNRIAGKSHPKLAPKEFGYVEQCYPILEKLFDHINFREDICNPDQIARDIHKLCEKHGTFSYTVDGEPNGYTPNDPDLTIIIIIDHIGLVDTTGYRSLKAAIDKVSSTLVKYRRLCNITPVVIQQFNSSMGSIERQKYKASALAPQKEDLGDSTYTFRDCDVFIGGIKPFDYDIPEYKGYKILGIGGLRDSATFWHIAKDRYGGGKHVIPLKRGIVPRFVELDPPNK